MQLSLRPYLTAGVAIAGASVIAVAPIQPIPTDIQIPNPTVQVVRDVQLTADEIETAWNDVVFQITELGLNLTVPLTAALIEAIAPDLIPPMGSADIVATGLLLGLSGYAISGGGSIGTALQDVVDGFGVDFGTGLGALLIGAPATIIDGYVNGGYGPDLATLLTPGVPPEFLPDIFAGGLIQNAGLQQLALGLQVCASLSCPAGLAPGNLVLPSLNSTLGTLLQAVLALVNPPEEAVLETAVVDEKISTFTAPNEDQLIDLPTQGEKGRGKPAAPGTTLLAPLKGLPEQAAGSAERVAGALETVEKPGRALGEAVKAAAKPPTKTLTGGTTVVRDSLMFEPPTGKKSGATSGSSDRPGAKISSLAKDIGDAVKGALGGGPKADTSDGEE